MADDKKIEDETKIVLLCDATEYRVGSTHFQQGFVVEGVLRAPGIVGYRKVPNPIPEKDRKAWDSETIDEPIMNDNAGYLVLRRSGESAMAKKLEELVAETSKRMSAEAEVKKLTTRIADFTDAEKRTDGLVDEVINLRAMKDKMERHLAVIRESIGTQRFGELVAKADADEEIPF